MAGFSPADENPVEFGILVKTQGAGYKTTTTDVQITRGAGDTTGKDMTAKATVV